MNTIRIALPDPANPGQTYNAKTDTNLDHFALYTDQDNVLIKEFSRGSFTITGNGSGVTKQIAHNLGYVPLFFVYVFDINSIPNKWKLLAHNSGGASAPPYTALADTANLNVINYLAAISGAVQFKYFIFYDNVAGSSGVTLTESDRVLKIPKAGFNAETEKDPNNMIFHSDLNTFKIIKEGNGSINYTGSGNYTFAHGATIPNLASYMVFIKFPDGYTSFLPGVGTIFSRNNAYSIDNSYIDSSNIGMHINGAGNNTFPYKYYIFETPLT